MDILLRILFFVAFGYMAMRMMRGGGCCGGGSHGSHRSHNSHESHHSRGQGGSSCCGGKKEKR